MSASVTGQPSEPAIVDTWEFYWPELGSDPTDDSTVDSASWATLPPNLIPPDREGRSRLWLQSDLDPTQGDLYLPGVFLLFSAYADGELLYSFQDRVGSFSTPWHIIPLPDDSSSGRTRVLLDIDSEYSRIGFMAMPMQGNRADIMQSIVRQDFAKIGLTFFYVFLALAAFVLATVKRDVSFAALGVLALAMAGYGLRYTQSRQFIEPDPAFWYYIWSLSLIFTMPAFLVFYRKVFPSTSKIISSLYSVNLAVSAIGLLLMLAVILNFDSQVIGNAFTLTLRLVLLISLVTVVSNAAQHWRSGNREAGILLIGILISLVLSAVDVLFAMGYIALEAPVGQWGTFTFILTLVAVLAFRYRETERALAKQAAKLAENTREKSLFIADLHDGIGTITSHISMLASAADSPNREMVDKIRNLALKGQDEIRSFMYSLDEGSEQLSTLAADMRRYGAELLEQNHIKLQFSCSGPLETVFVSSYSNLNLFRLYKEALQNVVKHADATFVSVVLDAMNDSIRIQIEDNGKGVQHLDAAKNSRGIKGMRDRVSQLGGKFAIDSRNGFTVNIELPREGVESA